MARNVSRGKQCIHIARMDHKQNAPADTGDHELPAGRGLQAKSDQPKRPKTHGPYRLPVPRAAVFQGNVILPSDMLEGSGFAMLG
jgi:hypothetical protein